jgi:hypothetical protein
MGRVCKHYSAWQQVFEQQERLPPQRSHDGQSLRKSIEELGRSLRRQSDEHILNRRIFLFDLVTG